MHREDEIYRAYNEATTRQDNRTSYLAPLSMNNAIFDEVVMLKVKRHCFAGWAKAVIENATSGIFPTTNNA